MLDPEIDRIVGSANSSGAPEYCDMSVEEARLAHEEKAPLLGAPALPLASVKDDQFKLVSENEMDEPVIGSPVPEQGNVFIRGEKHLYCIQATSANQ